MYKDDRKQIWITILLFVFIFAMRLPYLSNSPIETGESWRQSDTESMARNFVVDYFHILYPQLNYDGSPPNIAQLEFQLTTYLIALLYQTFGFHYELARLVPTLFFIGSAYFLYLLAKKYFSVEVAWMAILFYGLFPVNLFYSRAIMPESAALFFFIASFYVFSEWIERERNWLIFVSAILTALAISIKTPTIFVGLAMILMAIVKYKEKIVTAWQLWLFALVALVPPAIYFTWLDTVAEFTFVTGIGTKHILPEFTTAIFSSEAGDFFREHLPSSFTVFALVLGVIGALTINWHHQYPIGFLLLAVLLEVTTIVAVIQFNYYLIFLGPVLALVAAKALAVLLDFEYGHIGIALVLMVFAVSSYGHVNERFMVKEDILKQAEVIKQYTEADDLIVIGTFSPDLLNASERKGWRANIDYYDHIPTGPEDELNYFIEHGARYFFPKRGYIYNDGDLTYRNYLEDNFEKIEVQLEGEDYSFYQLE
ncbi:ArnT family glycosyltransferase [Desertibacillus haloalkaliphilus]|uniref:ArnT family glycosyltransferase n=1 Tax=Desertibacillus haloalkaliphilus TaxID=1328930 RepID=UPI001FE77914|nr:glycosyltransferase family 39 protein [Desertibacillus haloalkaliphilus]